SGPTDLAGAGRPSAMRPSARTAAMVSAAVCRRAPGMPRWPRVGPASQAPTDPARTDGGSGPSVHPERRTADSSAATLQPASTRAQLAAEKHLARRPDPGVVRDGRAFVSDRREGSAPRSLSRVLRALEVRLGVFPRPKGDLVRRHPRETEERKLDRAAFLRRVG